MQHRSAYTASLSLCTSQPRLEYMLLCPSLSCWFPVVVIAYYECIILWMFLETFLQISNSHDSLGDWWSLDKRSAWFLFTSVPSVLPWVFPTSVGRTTVHPCILYPSLGLGGSRFIHAFCLPVSAGRTSVYPGVPPWVFLDSSLIPIPRWIPLALPSQPVLNLTTSLLCQINPGLCPLLPGSLWESQSCFLSSLFSILSTGSQSDHVILCSPSVTFCHGQSTTQCLTMAGEVPHGPAPNYGFVFISVVLPPALCSPSTGLLPSALRTRQVASHLGHSVFTCCSLLEDSFPRIALAWCSLFFMSLVKLCLLREPFSVFIALSLPNPVYFPSQT